MGLMRKVVLVAAVWLLVVGTALAGQDYALTILHTNDIHAHLQPFGGVGAQCDQAADAAGKCFGGVARLATAVARERAKDGPSLLLDAGDQFQGTLYFTMFKGEPLALFMNRLGYDAMTLGNHEFDAGPATLAAFIKALKFPVVAADVNVSRSKDLRGLVVPYVVREVAGRKVGIVGASQPKTPEMSTPGPDVTFGKTVPAVTKAVKALKRKGVDIIVVVSHAGLEGDKKLAAAVPGVDVIVGGHSHVLLSNTAPEAVGPCPLVVPHPGVGPTLIVTAGFWGRYLGVLHVRFDKAGRVTRYDGDPVLLDASVPEDPDTVAALERFAKPLAAYWTTVLGQSEGSMDAAGCRREECQPGDLLAEALLAAGRKTGAVAALANGGSIRAGLPSGNITQGDVLTAFPFPDTLVTANLTGADLAAMLEHGLSRLGRRGGGGRFLQVAGLRYVFDPARPEGERLVEAQIADAGGWFSPLLPEATYRVALTNFLWRGGDGFAVRAKGREATETNLGITELVSDYIKQQSRLPQALDGRIRDVSAK